MKVNDEDYNIIKNGLINFIEQWKLKNNITKTYSELFEYWEGIYKEEKPNLDSELLILWNLYHTSRVYTKLTNIMPGGYSAYKDSHVQTALKKIKKELIEG